MPRHLTAIAYSAAACATMANGGTAAAIVGADSLTVQQCNGVMRVLAHHALNQTAAGFHKLMSQTMRDPGYKPVVAAGDLGNTLGRGQCLEFQAGEKIAATISENAVAGDVASGFLFCEYEDLPGMTGRYIGFDTLLDRMEPNGLVDVVATLASGAVAGGGYGTEEKINAENDFLMGNREYAFLGLTSSLNVAGAYLKGPDTGNGKIMCPGNAVDAYPRGNDYLCELSRTFRRACIPVISANNKETTFFGFISDENATAPVISARFALLKQPRGK